MCSWETMHNVSWIIVLVTTSLIFAFPMDNTSSIDPWSVGFVGQQEGCGMGLKVGQQVVMTTMVVLVILVCGVALICSCCCCFYSGRRLHRFRSKFNAVME